MAANLESLVEMEGISEEALSSNPGTAQESPYTTYSLLDMDLTQSLFAP